MKIHTGEKPLKYNQCDKAFIRIEHLKRHMKSLTEEKVDQCTVCDKYFIRHDDLKSHMKYQLG